MIELEIQALSERRQGLLVAIGHFVIASGFTLQRQRLIQDPNGILLTMVIRGPARKKRALEAALDADERIISFQLAPFVEGAQKPHFAASRTIPSYVPAPMPESEPEPVAEANTIATPNTMATLTTATVAFDQVEPVRLTAAPEPAPAHTASSTAALTATPQPEPKIEFILPDPPRALPAAAPAVAGPFVKLVPLEPDQIAIDKALCRLAIEYPQIMPRVLTLDRSVAEAARESSLRLLGRRIGSWVFEREHAQTGKLVRYRAIERIGVPALSALVVIEQEGSQLHIRHSPLCAEAGHSGCTFFSGFLEGVLGPALTSHELSIFAVCCRSYGADDCVLALSD